MSQQNLYLQRINLVIDFNQCVGRLRLERAALLKASPQIPIMAAAFACGPDQH